jgi:cytochrome c
MNAKVLTLAAMIAGTVMVAPAAQADEALAKKYGCMACHQVDKKVVGPSYKDVAAKYKGKADAPAMLAGKVKKGGSGVWGPVAMPPHPQVSDADMQKIIKWVLAQ